MTRSERAMRVAMVILFAACAGLAVVMLGLVVADAAAPHRPPRCRCVEVPR